MQHASHTLLIEMVSVRELADRFMQFQLAELPEYSTYRGFKLYEDKLDIVSPAFYRQRQEFCQKLLDDSLRIEVSKLEKADRLTLHILQNHAKSVLEGIKYGQHCNNVNYFEGEDQIFQRFALKNMDLGTVEGYRTLLKRLRGFPDKIDGLLDLLKTGIKEGVVQHQLAVVPSALERLRKSASCPPNELSLFEPFLTIPDIIPETERKQLASEGLEVMKNTILPHLAKLYNFVKDAYVPVLRTDLSINSIPGPSGRYEAIIKFHCELDISPEKIHNMGLEQIAFYKNRIIKIVKDQGFDGSMSEFTEYLKNKPELTFENAEDIMAYNKRVVYDRIVPTLPKLFNVPPDYPLKFEQENNDQCVAKAIYLGPPHDGSQPASIQIWTGDPRRFARYEAPVLMLHETYPGHHYETCMTTNRKSLPDFRRLKDDRRYNEIPSGYCMHSAYTEGWGLYCESLGVELNIYKDPLEEFAYLMYNITRCARAVVDTGIHHFRWSREKAQEFMKENTPLAANSREGEIDRYITWPGQGLAYMVGFLKIKELRAKAESELGDKFDIKAFHDIILGEGQVPLIVLEEIVDDYIKSNKPV